MRGKMRHLSRRPLVVVCGFLMLSCSALGSQGLSFHVLGSKVPSSGAPGFETARFEAASSEAASSEEPGSQASISQQTSLQAPGSQEPRSPVSSAVPEKQDHPVAAEGRMTEAAQPGKQRRGSLPKAARKIQA